MARNKYMASIEKKVNKNKVINPQTSNRSSSIRNMSSSYWFFFELINVESSDQEGNDTYVPFKTFIFCFQNTKKKLLFKKIDDIISSRLKLTCLQSSVCPLQIGCG